MTISEMIESLSIFAKYLDGGIHHGFFMGAEHDQIFVYVNYDAIPEGNVDHTRLDELGWFPDEDAGTWSRFV